MGIMTALWGVTRIKYKNMRPGNGDNFCVSFPTVCLGNIGCSWIPRPPGSWLRFSASDLTQGQFQAALHLTNGCLWELSTYQVEKAWSRHYESGERGRIDKS